MATTFSNFRAGYLMTLGNNTLISTSSGERKSISQFVLYNSSTSNVVVSFWLVGAGTGTVDTNVLDRVTVLPRRSVVVGKLVSQVLSPSFTLIGNADTANVIVVNASGVTET